jgi:hypothetical protein
MQVQEFVMGGVVMSAESLLVILLVGLIAGGFPG